MRNKNRLLTPGPTPLPERVRLALATDMVHHRTRAFTCIMEELQTGLRTLFGTRGPVLPLSASGTGAMTAAVHNLFAPGESVLVIEGGYFGQRWSKIAAARGLAVVPLEVAWGQAADPNDVADLLKRRPDIRGVLVQASETSTGVRHPVRELAAITAQTDTLLVVDGISAVGISPCPMDDWQLDCLLTGSQKGLMLPPGLSLLAFSERAWQRAEQTAPACFYFNLIAEREAVLQQQGQFTSPVNLLVGLAESLRMLLENGCATNPLNHIYQKQWALTSMTRAGLSAMNLSLFAPEQYTWGLTSVRLPDNNASAVLERLDREFGIILAGGQAATKNFLLRVGHMGWVDWGDVLAALSALEFILGHEATGASNRAMAAYHEALAAPCPSL